MKRGNESRIRNSILNLVSDLGGQLLTISLSFVTRTVFIHTLGKSYLGINGLFSNILDMLSLTELGFGTTIVFYLYRPLAEHDDKRVRVLMKFYKLAYRIVGFMMALFGLCLIPVLRFLILDYDSLAVLGINAILIYTLYLLRSVSSYLFFAYRKTIISANQKKYILNLVGYVVTIARRSAEIFILLKLADFTAYTAIAIVFSVLENYIDAVIAKHYYPQFFIPEADRLTRQEVFGLLRDCGAAFLQRLNGVVLKATDNIVLSAFVGLTIVGVYSNYLLFYNAILGILDGLYQAIRHSIGNFFSTESLSRRYNFFQVTNFLTIILYGSAAVGVAVCMNELLTAWIGGDYTIQQPFPVLVGVEILFVGLRRNLKQIRDVNGAFRQLWFCPVFAAGVNLAVSIWLVHICGIYGVIVGTIIADIVASFLVDPKVIHTDVFNRYRPVSDYYVKNLSYFAILFILCVADIWLCSWLIVGYGLISVIVHITVAGGSVPLIFFLVYRKSQECKYLLNLGSRILRRTIAN